MLLFDSGTVQDIRMVNHALSLYKKSTRMEINEVKSCMIFNLILDVLLMECEKKNPFPCKDLDYGFKYLVFIASLIHISLMIRLGFTKKGKQKFICGFNNTLRGGGHLIIINLVLESILVYWMSIA